LKFELAGGYCLSTRQKLIVTKTMETFILEIRMGNTTIEEIETHKHLGIILQSNGKWGGYIKPKHAVKKCQVMNAHA
jgi:hypothetical protein